MTLGPHGPKEQILGGFQHGGWATPYADPVLAGLAGEGMARSGGLLLGRRTYESLYEYWPKQRDNPFTDVLNNAPKYVASTTLKEPLPWGNSTLLKGGVPEAVAELKAQPGKDLTVLGSGELVQTLRQHDLVDEYVLLIHPLILGTGRRLFPEGSPATALRLVDTKATTTGVVIATYQPAEPWRRPELEALGDAVRPPDTP